MLDRNQFTETLRSVAEIRRTSPMPLSREEIMGYFQDMELTEEQQEMVYAYLQMPPEEEAETENSQEEEILPEEAPEENIYFQMYLEDLKGVKSLDQEELRKSYESLLLGDAKVMEKISETWLERILTMARAHGESGDYLGDLIQEGNMGLFLKLTQLLGAGVDRMPSIEEELAEAVEAAISAYEENTLGEDDSENAVLGKVSLLHEAQKVLKEDLGRIPDTKELSEYTKISEEEIADILAMTKEK